jgi:hypothetical protein
VTDVDQSIAITSQPISKLFVKTLQTLVFSVIANAAIFDLSMEKNSVNILGATATTFTIQLQHWRQPAL